MVTLRQVWCGWSTGHERILRVDEDRQPYTECMLCGHTSHGWGDAPAKVPVAKERKIRVSARS